MKKGLAIVLALVMVFAMTATAFATDLDPNLTMVDFSQARTSYQQSGLQSAQTLVLKATTANTGWSATNLPSLNPVSCNTLIVPILFQPFPASFFAVNDPAGLRLHSTSDILRATFPDKTG